MTDDLTPPEIEYLTGLRRTEPNVDPTPLIHCAVPGEGMVVEYELENVGYRGGDFTIWLEGPEGKRPRDRDGNLTAMTHTLASGERVETTIELDVDGAHPSEYRLVAHHNPTNDEPTTEKRWVDAIDDEHSRIEMFRDVFAGDDDLFPSERELRAGIRRDVAISRPQFAIDILEYGDDETYVTVENRGGLTGEGAVWLEGDDGSVLESVVDVILEPVADAEPDERDVFEHVFDVDDGDFPRRVRTCSTLAVLEDTCSPDPESDSDDDRDVDACSARATPNPELEDPEELEAAFRDEYAGDDGLFPREREYRVGLRRDGKVYTPRFVIDDVTVDSDGVTTVISNPGEFKTEETVRVIDEVGGLLAKADVKRDAGETEDLLVELDDPGAAKAVRTATDVMRTNCTVTIFWAGVFDRSSGNLIDQVRWTEDDFESLSDPIPLGYHLSFSGDSFTTAPRAWIDYLRTADSGEIIEDFGPDTLDGYSTTSSGPTSFSITSAYSTYGDYSLEVDAANGRRVITSDDPYGLELGETYRFDIQGTGATSGYPLRASMYPFSNEEGSRGVRLGIHSHDGAVISVGGLSRTLDIDYSNYNWYTFEFSIGEGILEWVVD